MNTSSTFAAKRMGMFARSISAIRLVFYSPIWSPDSKKIAYTAATQLWYVDVDKEGPAQSVGQ